MRNATMWPICDVLPFHRLVGCGRLHLDLTVVCLFEWLLRKLISDF